MSFRIHALEPYRFEPLFAMSGAELAKYHAIRTTVD